MDERIARVPEVRRASHPARGSALPIGPGQLAGRGRSRLQPALSPEVSEIDRVALLDAPLRRSPAMSISASRPTHLRLPDLSVINKGLSPASNWQPNSRSLLSRSCDEYEDGVASANVNIRITKARGN